MEIGSLVECIKLSGWSKPEWGNVNVPKVGKIYTIRGFYNSSYGHGVSLYLEEIINRPTRLSRIEPSFSIKEFREVLPPMDIMEKIFEENEIIILK